MDDKTSVDMMRKQIDTVALELMSATTDAGFEDKLVTAFTYLVLPSKREYITDEFLNTRRNDFRSGMNLIRSGTPTITKKFKKRHLKKIVPIDGLSDREIVQSMLFTSDLQGIGTFLSAISTNGMYWRADTEEMRTHPDNLYQAFSVYNLADYYTFQMLKTVSPLSISENMIVYHDIHRSFLSWLEPFERDALPGGAMEQNGLVEEQRKAFAYMLAVNRTSLHALHILRTSQVFSI